MPSPQAATKSVLKNQDKQHGRHFVPPMRPSVKCQRVKFWCLYCTKLELILNRTPATRRARGDADAKRTHWRVASAPPPLPLRRAHAQNFLAIFCGSSPDPSAAKRKTERKGNFGVRRRYQIPTKTLVLKLLSLGSRTNNLVFHHLYQFQISYIHRKGCCHQRIAHR